MKNGESSAPTNQAQPAAKANRSGRHGLRYSIIAALVVLVIVAGVVAGAVVYQSRETYSSDSAAPPGNAALQVNGPDDSAQLPDIQAALAGPAANEALGRLAGKVSDAATGQTLWEKDANTALVPASSTKLLTSTAALLTLGSDDRVSTVVRRGTEPGQIVLVGGGDITLAEDKDSAFYTDAPTVEDLAAQVKSALGQETVTSVVVDNSRVAGGDTFNSTWDGADIAGGNVTKVDSVMINGGRLDYTNEDSPRTDNPAHDAGVALAKALGADTNAVSVSTEAVASGGAVVGEVKSAPLDIRLRDMLVHSDNMEAEAVGREVAAAAHKPVTFSGASEAVLETLASHGFSTKDVVLKDTCGMSKDNRITPNLLDAVLLAAASENENDAAALRPMLDAVPIAAGSGTLAGRYQAGSSSSAGAGWVRAKTGTLDGVSALAGTVMTTNNRVLTFAFMSNGSDIEPARAALDDLAAALRTA